MRGSILQSPLSQGESPRAPHSQSGRHRSGSVEGEYFPVVYRRLEPRLGHQQIIETHRSSPCRLIWLILHRGAH